MNLLVFSIILLIFKICHVSCYRQIHFTNADACDPDGTTQTLHIGEGALVLYLNNDSFHANELKNLQGEKKICNLLIKTKKGLGLLVYAEEMDLRQEKNEESGKDVCVDYVEFGQEDVIPFITLKRSGRLCGYRAAHSLYDDPEGQLLIWLKLGLSSANRSEVNSPGPAPRLTLVITPYSTKRDYQLKKCQRGEYWIRKKYFCDGRVNCPKDPDPLDEADVSCATTPAPPPPSTTPRPPGVFECVGGKCLDDDSWDFSFVLIVLISIVGLLVIACGIVCTLKKCGLGPQPLTPDTENCPETSFGMLQLSQRSEENTYVTQPAAPAPRRPTDFSPPTPSYSAVSAPGASVTGHTTSIRMPKQSPLLSRNIQEAPPPSYNDIFPPDYVPDPSIMRGQAAEQQQEQQNSDTSV